MFTLSRAPNGNMSATQPSETSAPPSKVVEVDPLDATNISRPEWSVSKIRLPVIKERPPRPAVSSDGLRQSVAAGGYDPYAGAVARRKGSVRIQAVAISSERIEKIRQLLRPEMAGQSGAITLELVVSADGWIQTVTIVSGELSDAGSRRAGGVLIGVRLIDGGLSRAKRLRLKLVL